MRQAEVYLGGVRGRRMPVPSASPALEEAARRAMTAEAFAYVAGGAGLESTMAANRAAFERWRIVPRMLRDVSVRDTTTELLGLRLPAPVLLAPIGVLELAHPEADVAVARAAAAEGIPMILSSQASRPMEECAEAMGSSPRWFQLYWSTSNELVASLVSRAEACGCAAIVLTLDTAFLGWRSRDLDLAYLPFLRGKGLAQYTSDPVFQQLLDEPAATAPPVAEKPNLAALRTLLELSRAYPGSFWRNLRSPRPRAAVAEFLRIIARPSLTWDDLSFLRTVTSLPLVLKGVLDPVDARRAAELGIDGIVVSNHGGRQVDGALGSLDALSGVVEAVAGRIPVLLDSGVRGGADVFKAIALGASAVLLGRPYVYGLAVAGQAGVQAVIRNLIADFDLTMGLSGCARLGEISRDLLVPIP